MGGRLHQSLHTPDTKYLKDGGQGNKNIKDIPVPINALI
jgi:hypothetical protein